MFHFQSMQNGLVLARKLMLVLIVAVTGNFPLVQAQLVSPPLSEGSVPFISTSPFMEGMEVPVAISIPGISASGLAFYAGMDFPAWTTSVSLV